MTKEVGKAKTWIGTVMAGAFAALTCAPAQAAVTVSIQEVGGNVVATTTGSFDPAGMARGDINYISQGLNGDLAAFNSIDSSARSYFGLAGPAAFGSGSVFYRLASSATGTFFGVVGAFGEVRLADSYVAGAPIAATTTFAGQSLQSLNLTNGVYEFAAPNDMITVIIGGSGGGVPEPATWAMLILGFGVIGGAVRRRNARIGSSALALRYC